MATRRTTTRVEVPLPDRNNPPTTNSTRPAHPTASQTTTTHPSLPTPLEALFLTIYPLTLLLGSLASHLSPATRSATYNPTTQAYDPSTAPSYFARKSNLFNVYFVKIGWFWISLAWACFVLGHGSLKSHGQGLLGRRRVQAGVRYVVVTCVWIAVTQWFFGAPIIDRSFRWTGGRCQALEIEREEGGFLVEGEVEKAFTHAACKAVGGRWAGGHDISGHVFLLILGSAVLWLELLPAVLKMEGLREARRVRMGDGSLRSAAFEARRGGGGGDDEGAAELGWATKLALGVAGLSWWMLLMTAAYFHTWFEKFTGLLVAFAAVYAVYFLPRGLPAWRRVVGMPGV
ncbi:hypothetical protein B0A50_01931 [Salinomyces thailandicus]|uniref:Acyl-coenzyme A diphosphatase SCS3 n=1 Tax=Salinomyces thailandicus TaxID=706561 RepID=A0A4U0U6Y0_9PEZI|nr:hypothetical protein B0A50_01931 [Salinomyces thailandica]